MTIALIDVHDLHANLNNADWLLLDCQYDLMDKDAGHAAYRKAHIPGAVYVRLDTDLSNHKANTGGRHPLPEQQQLIALFSALGITPTTQVLAYDASAGAFAARLWWLLRYAGHAKVAVLNGGLNSWLEAGYPVESKESAATPAQSQFQAAFTDTMFIDHTQVPHSKLLIDSREPERYRGEQEPIDPIAGHIPGAVNRCWKQNINASGEFKPATELAAELQQLFADVPPQESVFYCGSGVSACHNLLATAHAGLPLPVLYPGSWSEWCADPARPIATGEAG
ncbi:MAG: sulfurtransferase [Gammaproteobacteria bacterium]